MRHTKNIQPLYSYRAFVYPVTASAWDLDGVEGGWLQQPIHLKATSSEDAQDKAQWLTGKAVLKVERKA